MFFLDNPVFAIDQQVELRWSADLNQYSISLWQQGLVFGVATMGPNIYSKSPA
jgi:hypothetical protein